jgi:hypothetical protein
MTKVDLREFWKALHGEEAWRFMSWKCPKYTKGIPQHLRDQLTRSQYNRYGHLLIWNVQDCVIEFLDVFFTFARGGDEHMGYVTAKWLKLLSRDVRELKEKWGNVDDEG